MESRDEPPAQQDSGRDRSRIEFTLPTDQVNSIIERSFRATVGTAGFVDLSLTPTAGKLGLRGIVVEPLFTPGQAKVQELLRPSYRCRDEAGKCVASGASAGEAAGRPRLDSRHLVHRRHGRPWGNRRGRLLEQAMRWAESNQWQPGKEKSAQTF